MNVVINMEETEERYLSNSRDQKRYKLIIVGDSGVGKTTLFWHFVQGQGAFEGGFQVTTVDFKIKNVNIDNQAIKLYIWDTAGQQKYRSIVSTYFKGCNGVLLVFDLSHESSFRNVKEQWYQLCRSKTQRAIIMLVGNKSDLQQTVNEDEVKQWCDINNLKYMRTSVKTNSNVQQSFMELARHVHQNQQFHLSLQMFHSNSLNSKRMLSLRMNKGEAETFIKKKKCC